MTTAQTLSVVKQALLEKLHQEIVPQLEALVQGLPEQLLIHLEPDWERRNWCSWLGCSEQELEHAVTYVGHDPDNVRRFLRQAR